MTESRNVAGRFVKGQSGNPGGRPKQDPETREALRAASPAAARKLVELLKSKNEKIAFQAAQEILNRTEGKPRESVSMDLSAGVDMRAQIRSVLLERLDGQRAEATD